jgi:hypothetical protein
MFISLKNSSKIYPERVTLFFFKSSLHHGDIKKNQILKINPGHFFLFPFKHRYQKLRGFA